MQTTHSEMLFLNSASAGNKSQLNLTMTGSTKCLSLGRVVCILCIRIPNSPLLTYCLLFYLFRFFLHAALQMLSEKKTEVPPVMMMPPPMEPVMFPLSDRPMKAPCKILDAVDFDDFILHHHHGNEVRTIKQQ